MEDLRQTLINDAEASRKRMHALIDHDYDELINRFRSEEGIDAAETAPVYFSTDASVFKTTKPKEVIFSDGHVTCVNTWRNAVKALLADCNKQKHDELLLLCNEVYGNQRKLLSSTRYDMDAPIMVDDGIFFEGHFATDTLIRVLKEKIFDAVGYDYSEIRIRLR
ncbi:MAG TPA: hypothetical protein P5092_14425 [Ruminococcus sp.]|nr:hypothetical protein [Ruminococcus sp.]